jgi:hypothetical protein
MERSEHAAIKVLALQGDYPASDSAQRMVDDAHLHSR